MPIQTFTITDGIKTFNDVICLYYKNSSSTAYGIVTLDTYDQYPTGPDYIYQMVVGFDNALIADALSYVNATPPDPQLPLLSERPGQYYKIDIDNMQWVLDYDYFNSEFFVALSDHRDEKIQEESTVQLTYDEGGLDEENLSLSTNARTLEAVGRKSLVAPISNDPNMMVNFKFSGFTSSGVNDRGYRNVTTGFMQTFYEALDAFNQKHFDAEKYILETHDSTPYTDFQTAFDDFDTFLATP